MKFCEPVPRRLIAQAVEPEFETFLTSDRGIVLPDGRRRVVRHGHDPVSARSKQIGPIEVQSRSPRSRRRVGERIRFTSNILPNGARRTKSLDALLPFSICADFRRRFSRRPSPLCSARTRPTFPQL